MIKSVATNPLKYWITYSRSGHYTLTVLCTDGYKFRYTKLGLGKPQWIVKQLKEGVALQEVNY